MFTTEDDDKVSPDNEISLFLANSDSMFFAAFCLASFFEIPVQMHSILYKTRYI